MSSRTPAICLLLVLILAVPAIPCAGSVDVSWRPEPPKVEDGLVERVFVDDKPAPKPTQIEQGRKFILYSRPMAELIFPNSVPMAKERVTQLKTFAAPGQYQPVTFAVYTLGDLSNIRVTAGALRTAKGAVIPAENLEVRVARSVFKRLDEYAGPGDFMYMPTWLSKEDAVNVPAKRSEWFWVTVRVPDNAKPGLYKGAISIAAEETVRLPLEIDVLPIKLADNPINLGFYDSPSREKLAQQREYGATSVGTHDNSGVKLTLSGDSVDVDVTGSTIANTLTAYKELGYTKPLLWLMGDDIWEWCKKQSPDDARRCADLYISALTKLRQQIAEKGWAEVIVQPDDECASVPERMASSELRLPFIKKAGFRTEMDHYLAYSNKEDDAWVARTIQYVDVITLRYWDTTSHGQPPWPEVVKRVADEKKELWTYNITAAHCRPQPSTMRFNGGWFFRSLGSTCKGMYYWAYACISGDAYNDLDTQYGDMSYWYPPDPARGLSGGPSIDLVCLRAGADDLRYIVTLEQLAAKKKSGAFDSSNLQASLKLTPFNFALATIRNIEGTQCDWQFKGERDGVKIATGWYLYPNGWTSADYDKAREKVAKQILKLQGK